MTSLWSIIDVCSGCKEVGDHTHVKYSAGLSVCQPACLSAHPSMSIHLQYLYLQDLSIVFIALCVSGFSSDQPFPIHVMQVLWVSSTMDMRSKCMFYVHFLVIAMLKWVYDCGAGQGMLKVCMSRLSGFMRHLYNSIHLWKKVLEYRVNIGPRNTYLEQVFLFLVSVCIQSSANGAKIKLQPFGAVKHLVCK